MYLSIYLSTYIYTHTYIYIYIHIYVYIYRHISIYMHIYILWIIHPSTAHAFLTRLFAEKFDRRGKSWGMTPEDTPMDPEELKQVGNLTLSWGCRAILWWTKFFVGIEKSIGPISIGPWNPHEKSLLDHRYWTKKNCIEMRLLWWIYGDGDLMMIQWGFHAVFGSEWDCEWDSLGCLGIVRYQKLQG